MSIDKALNQAPAGLGNVVPFSQSQPSLAPPPEAVETPVDQTESETQVPHDTNLAELLDEQELDRIANDLLSGYADDLESRRDWLKAYKDGLDLLGFKFEERTTPWSGSCGVYHPILNEAVTRFVAQTIMEVFPASGPVKTKIVGQITDEKVAQARRVEDNLNYYLTEKMPEYRSETEQLLMGLAICGSAFRKVYYDSSLGRPVAAFVPAEDLVVSYETEDLDTSPRFCHRMRRTSNELKKSFRSGFYRQVDLLPTQAMEQDELQQKLERIEGRSQSGYSKGHHTVLEFHAELNLPGLGDSEGQTGESVDESGAEDFEVADPYIVTIEKESRQVLAIRRNWVDSDPLRRRSDYFVHFKLHPGLGFYGFGFIHTIGGIAKSATSMLRQLVDAGTLSNLPGGFKAKGLRIKGDDSPIMPGEWRDVDIPGQALKDSIMPLPYKEPSATLVQLLGNMVDEGRRFVSLDLDIAEGSQQTPVGTTLAILERSMKVMSAIHARIHASLRQEFDLLVQVIKNYLPPGYEYDQGGGATAVGGQGNTPGLRATDFDDRVDILPVSDPNATTFSQRVLTQQTALQIAAGAPQLYNLRELHKGMLDAIGIENVELVLPDPGKQPPLDPIAENANSLMMVPLKAFEYQNHKAHIQAHQAFLSDPRVQNNPLAQQILPSLLAHVNEHLAYQYVQEIEGVMGAPLPKQGQGPIPPQLEAALAPMVARAAQVITGQKQQEAAAQQAAQNAQDPVLINQQKELEIKAQDVQRKGAADQLKAQTDIQKANIRKDTEMARLAVQKKMNDARVAAQVLSDHNSHQAQAHQTHQSNLIKAATAHHAGHVKLATAVIGAHTAKEKAAAKPAPAPKKEK